MAIASPAKAASRDEHDAQQLTHRVHDPPGRAPRRWPPTSKPAVPSVQRANADKREQGRRAHAAAMARFAAEACAGASGQFRIAASAHWLWEDPPSVRMW